MSHPSQPDSGIHLVTTFKMIPPGLPNRLEDGSVIIAVADQDDFESFLVRTRVGEFVKLVRYRSRGMVARVLDAFRQEGSCDEREAQSIYDLDRLPAARGGTRRTRPAPQPIAEQVSH